MHTVQRDNEYETATIIFVDVDLVAANKKGGRLTDLRTISKVFFSGPQWPGYCFSSA